MLALGILGDHAVEEENLTDINTECTMDSKNEQKANEEINLTVWRDELLKSCSGK